MPVAGEYHRVSFPKHSRNYCIGQLTTYDLIYRSPSPDETVTNLLASASLYLLTAIPLNPLYVNTKFTTYSSTYSISTSDHAQHRSTPSASAPYRSRVQTDLDRQYWSKIRYHTKFHSAQRNMSPPRTRKWSTNSRGTSVESLLSAIRRQRLDSCLPCFSFLSA